MQKEEEEPTSWSVRQKHTDIVIQRNLIGKSLASKPWRWTEILTNTILSDQPVKCKIKIISIKSSIFLGLCLQSVTEKGNFTHQHLQYIDHGRCMIGFQGTVFDHRFSNAFNQRGQFQFKEGDILDMLYEPGEFSIWKQKSRLWKFELLQPHIGDCYRICVHLLNHGDSVEIVSQ